MTEKKEKFSSTFTLDNFSSTTKLADHEVKIPVGSRETINEKDELYNPFDHRVLTHPTSTIGSLIHLLKGSLGSGILAIPNAFKNGGLMFGFFGTLIVGILCTHCVHILVRASRELCKRSKTPALGFSETAEAAFQYGPKKLRPWAPVAKTTVDASLIITYYMGSCVYVVFIAESLQQLVNFYFPEAKWSIFMYMLLILPFLIITCQIRELKYLVPFSFLANTFLVISFSITLYYIFNDLHPKVDELKMMGSFAHLPLFFSTVIFAMEGIGVVLPIENNMKKPQQFLGCPSVLNVSMGAVVTIYALIGLFGYLKYGEGTAGSITFNLPVEEIPAQAVKLLVALSIFFTYSLQFYVPTEICWTKMIQPHLSEKYYNLGQILLRAGTVIMSVGVAALVPRLEPIIALVGSICFSTLGIFIPSVVDTVVRLEDGMGRFKWILFKNVFLAFLSMFALISGTYQSVLLFRGA